MTTATQRRPQTSAPTDGSRTITLRDTQPRPEDDDASGGGAGPSTGETQHDSGRAQAPRCPAAYAPACCVGRRRRRQRRMREEKVQECVLHLCTRMCKSVDLQPVCCIYHKPRRFDESSSESESASASDSESDEGGGWRHGDDRARPTRRHRHASHGHGCGHDTVRRERQCGTVHELHHADSDSDVNTYERAPKRKS
jgi:protein phosphatase 1 regulatory subunit 11